MKERLDRRNERGWMVQASFQLIPDCYTDSSGGREEIFVRSVQLLQNSFVLFHAVIQCSDKRSLSNALPRLFLEAKIPSLRSNRSAKFSPPFATPFSTTISEWNEQVVRQTIPSCSCNANVHSAHELLNDLEFSSSTSTLAPPRSPPHLRVSRTFCRRCLELPPSLCLLVNLANERSSREPRSNLLFPPSPRIRFQIDS